jgi:hypothetical protein
MEVYSLIFQSGYITSLVQSNIALCLLSDTFFKDQSFCQSEVNSGFCRRTFSLKSGRHRLILMLYRSIRYEKAVRLLSSTRVCFIIWKMHLMEPAVFSSLSNGSLELICFWNSWKGSDQGFKIYESCVEGNFWLWLNNLPAFGMCPVEREYRVSSKCLTSPDCNTRWASRSREAKAHRVEDLYLKLFQLDPSTQRAWVNWFWSKCYWLWIIDGVLYHNSSLASKIPTLAVG